MEADKGTAAEQGYRWRDGGPHLVPVSFSRKSGPELPQDFYLKTHSGQGARCLSVLEAQATPQQGGDMPGKHFSACKQLLRS